MGFWKSVTNIVKVAAITAAVVYTGGAAMAAMGVAGATMATAATMATTAFVMTAVSGAVNAVLADEPDIPDAGSSISGQLVTTRKPAENARIVYGKTRVGGNIVFMELTNGNKDLYMVMTLAGHQIDDVSNIYANDTVIKVNPDFNTRYNLSYNGKSGYLSVEISNGSDDGTTFNLLSGTSGANKTFKGLACMAVRLKYNQDVFAQGVPNFTCELTGKNSSANAATAIKTYLLDAEYGLGADASEIDTTAFSAAETTCDEVITLADASTEKRYTVNGAFGSGEAPQNILQKMLMACSGSLVYQGGQWKLLVGEYRSPTVELTEDDLVDAISVSTSDSRRDTFNAVKGIYSEPSSLYQSQSYSPVTNVFYTSEDGETIYRNVDFQLVTSNATCQRLAKIQLEKARQQIVVNLSCNLKAFQVQVGDTVQLTLDRYGWSQKEFEVLAWDADMGSLNPTVNLSLRETASGVYDWADGEETALDLAENTNLPDPFDIEAPGLNVFDELAIIAEKVVTKLVVKVSGDSTFFDRYEVEAKLTTDDEYINLGQASGTRFELLDAADGSTYDIRARQISTMGVRSDYATTQHQVIGKTEPPADVTNLSANVINGQVQLNWSPVADLDLSHYLVRYQNVIVGASYQNANNVVEKVPRPANSLTTEARTGTYFVRAIDKLGLPSANPASIVVTTDMLAFDNLNVVETDTENPSFSGITNNVAVVDNSLVLNTSLLFDSATGDFDDFTGNFDGGGGSVALSGTYDFANIIDLSEKYTSRVIADLTTGRREYINLFDEASGLFDNREGNFDGDQTAFDTTDVQLFVRTSDTGSNPIAPEFGLTLSQTIPNATRIEGSSDTGINLDSPERGEQIHFQVDSIILPTAATATDGGLFEMGGGGVGSFVGIRDSGATFRLRAGDGASSFNVNDTVILDIDIATSPYFDGNAHKLNWEFEPDGTAYIKVWIDNVLVGTANTANNSNMEGGNWHGGGDGFYGTNTFSQGNVGNEPTTAWQHGTPSGLKVYEQQGSTYDPSVWTDYRRFVVGDYSARSFQFRAELTTSEPTASPIVTALSATVDMPDRIDEKRDRRTHANGFNDGTFNHPFKAIPALSITVQNQQQGDYYVLSDITTDGYTINIYDSGGNPADRTYDIMAKGYGRRIT